ncbi:hypothetical protein OG894_43985 (plasmid) [Streptomyces sp. NBC_01724]|uniref:hypothetical protein n=1 Tax=Streptomyces sp. NBC_01724 TaxID=2975922 RepID=UPI002E3205CF|nr:hypothetical protein [Streptomyces sp. NBC_01724]
MTAGTCAVPVLRGEGDADLLALLVEGGDVLTARWLMALGACSTRQSSDVAVNSSCSAWSNITARSRQICPYSEVSQKLPWWAETFSICSCCGEPAEPLHRLRDRVELAGLHQ